MKIKLSDPRLAPLTDEQLDQLSSRELRSVIRTERAVLAAYRDHAEKLEEKVEQTKAYADELRERLLEVEGHYLRVRSRLFKPSSERSRCGGGHPRGGRGRRGNGARLPSERYPHAEIIEKDITCAELPTCNCCGATMQDSGMVETSEYLTVIPKRYIVVRQQRHKYRCGGCHGSVVTVPALPRVTPGSSYSDEMVIDATLSKYCDLIPMERYCQMADRQGFSGLPPQSLIGATFKLAEFLRPAYELLKEQTLAANVLMADETPHRMLEGDEKSRWYLWAFLTPTSCFFECHDTRSGDVASAVLAVASCTVLLSDVYSGYRKAVREANVLRIENGKPLITAAYCNAHARRGFKTADEEILPEAQVMIDHYRSIYTLEASVLGKAADCRAPMKMGPRRQRK